MRTEAFQRGDMDVLQEAVDATLDLTWALARRGFVWNEDGVPQYVHGITDHDVAEQEVAELVAELMSPARRQTIDGLEQLRAAALRLCQERLRVVAIRAGRVTSLATEAAAAQRPDAVEDIEALIAEGHLPSDATVPYDADDAARLAGAQAVCAEVEATCDERSRSLLQQRFRDGRTPAEVAADFDCGVAAVATHESRLRRRLRRALREAHPDAPAGPATIDAAVSGRFFDAAPPPITRARIARDALRRTFQEEPASYGRRLGWGLGAAAIALLGWGAMYLGYLPHPDDDPYPAPVAQLSCDGPCEAGKSAQLTLLAPEDATRYAAWVQAEPEPRPLLVSPTGGTLRLPLGARGHEVPSPYAGRWPAEVASGAPVIVIFTEDELDAESLRAVAAGHTALPGVTTVTAGLR